MPWLIPPGTVSKNRPILDSPQRKALLGQLVTKSGRRTLDVVPLAIGSPTLVVAGVAPNRIASLSPAKRQPLMYRLRRKKVNLEKKMLALVLERWYSLALSQQPTPIRARERLTKHWMCVCIAGASGDRPHSSGTPAMAQRAPSGVSKSLSPPSERANLNRVYSSKERVVALSETDRSTDLVLSVTRRRRTSKIWRCFLEPGCKYILG